MAAENLGILNKCFYFSFVPPENWHLVKSHQWKEILFSPWHVRFQEIIKIKVLAFGLILELTTVCFCLKWEHYFPGETSLPIPIKLREIIRGVRNFLKCLKLGTWKCVPPICLCFSTGFLSVRRSVLAISNSYKGLLYNWRLLCWYWDSKQTF